MITQIAPISHPYVTLIIVVSVFSSLSTVFVILRYCSRRLSGGFGLDDWTAVGALFFALGFLIANVLAATIGMAGYHQDQIDMAHYQAYTRCLLANNIVYNTSITLSKLSVVLMYRRLFAVRSFRIWTWPVFFLLAAYWLCCFFGELLAYTPIEGQWYPLISSTHIDVFKFGLAMAGYNITMDVIILTMPQFRVWRLCITKQKKVLLSFVFLLGGFVCIASIVRLIYLVRISYADPTYTLSVAGIWTAVEVNMAIVCACLPTLPHLFRHWYDGKQPDQSMKSTGSFLGRKMVGWMKFSKSRKSN